MESVAAVTTLPASAATGRHIPALDGIRALAILLVIPHNVDTLSAPFPKLLLPVAILLHAGWIGVQLFFVLSGFLITGNLLDSRRADNYFSAFFGRRALRILPLYFATLFAAFVITPLFVTLPDAMRATESHQIWLWTFLSNWTEPYDGGVYGFGHFWSLAVEEQFYLLWPLIVLRCGPRALLWVCAASVALALAVRVAFVVAHLPHETLYMFTICRMDALTLGAAAAALIRIPEVFERLKHLTTRVAIGAGLALLATAGVTRAFAMYDVSTQTVGYTVLSLAFALVILLTVLPTTGVLRTGMNVLSWKPLRLIGRYSYGMYVLHLPLHVFFGAAVLRQFTSHPDPLQSLTYTTGLTLASFLLAAASYELFEVRFLRMKRWLVPSGNTTQATVGL
jgi:peptidoglycan/LPS O-acetylase OafA/YrhL